MAQHGENDKVKMRLSLRVALTAMLIYGGLLWAQPDTLRQNARGGKPQRPALADTSLQIGPQTARGGKPSPDTTLVRPGGPLAKADSNVVRIDTLPGKAPRLPKRHSPLRATLLSAALPGLGQIYNRKYWKAPIVWAVMGGTGYWMVSSRQTYRYWRFQYLYRVDEDPLTLDENPSIATSTLKAQRDQAHSGHEWSIIAFTVGYLLNITDAFVDAHLFDFDVSNDLSFRLLPGQPAWAGAGLGMGATVQIRF